MFFCGWVLRYMTILGFAYMGIVKQVNRHSMNLGLSSHSSCLKSSWNFEPTFFSQSGLMLLVVTSA